MSASVIAFHNYGWLLVPLRPLYGLFKGCFGNLVVPDFAEQQSQAIENEGVEIAFWARDQTLMSIIMQQELYCAMVSRSAKVLFLLCLAANATQMEAVARVYKFLEEEQEIAVTIPIDSKSRNEIGPKVASKRFRAYLCHLGYSFYAEAKEYVLETYLTKRRADCLPALMI